MDRWLSLLIQFAIPVLRSIVRTQTIDKFNQLSLEDKPSTFLALPPGDLESQSDSLEIDRTPSSIRQVFNTQTLELVQMFLESNAWDFWDFSKEEKSVSAWELQQEQFIQAKKLQQNWIENQRQILLELADRQRETTLKLPEVRQILEHWPLRLFPSQLLDSQRNAGITPLRILLAPPNIQYDRLCELSVKIPSLELQLAQGMREFISQYYPLHSSTRSTEFLGGAWESKRFHSESSIKALFHFLSSEPTLILESETDGDRLIFRIAYWGLEQKTYYYRSLLSLSYRQFLEESAKTRALKWKLTREKLLNLGKSREEIDRLSGDNSYNLQVLEEASQLQEAGIDPADLNLNYKLNDKDFEALSRFLTTCHYLVAGWVADIYHFIRADVPPLLPTILPEILRDFGDRAAIDSFLDISVAIYRDVLKLLTLDRPYWQPELTLKLALSFSELPDKPHAKTQIEDSIEIWLKQRHVSLDLGLDSVLDSTSDSILDRLNAMRDLVTAADEAYLRMLQTCFQAIGDDGGLRVTEELLQSIVASKPQPGEINFTIDRTLSELPEAVEAIALSPDGQTVYSSCSHHSEIRVYSLESEHPERPQRNLSGHPGGVLTLALSGDGRFLASSDRSKHRSYIRIWDVATGKLQRTLFGHRKSIYALAIAPDGRTLASGSHKVKLWHIETGEPFRTLFGHQKWVYALAISPDGRTVVSGSEDSSLRVWDIPTGDLRYTLKGHGDRVRSVAVSPDGQTIASGSDDRSIRLWDLETGQFLDELRDHSHSVRSLTFCSDGRYLISSSQDKTVKIWHLDRRQVVQTLIGHEGSVNSIALTPNGRTLVSGSEDRSIRIWQARSVSATS